MRLQEVLKDREKEISSLEESLKESQQENSNSIEDDVHEVDGNPLANSSLSPKTLNQFDNIRKTMQGTNGHAIYTANGISNPEDEPLERLNELMLYVLL